MGNYSFFTCYPIPQNPHIAFLFIYYVILFFVFLSQYFLLTDHIFYYFLFPFLLRLVLTIAFLYFLYMDFLQIFYMDSPIYMGGYLELTNC